jgi:hypothetical protein
MRLPVSCGGKVRAGSDIGGRPERVLPDQSPNMLNDP